LFHSSLHEDFCCNKKTNERRQVMKKDKVALGAAAFLMLFGGVAQAGSYDFGGGPDQGDVVYESAVGAQIGPDQMLSGEVPGVPINARPGECYSRCIAPAKYKTVTEKVLVRPATEKIVPIPGKYRWVEKRIIAKDASERVETVPPRFEDRTVRVMVRPPSERLRVIPAKYDTRQEQVVIKPASTRNVTTPPVFKTVKQRILVQAASTKWIRTAVPCTLDDVKLGLTDCETLCLVETPAMYKTVIKKVLVTPASQRTVTLPAEFETVTKTVVVEPAKVLKETIPAEYKTITKTVMVEPAKTRRIPVPPEYKTIRVKQVVQEPGERRIPVPPKYETVTKRVKVSDSKIVWRAVVCEDQIKDTKVIQVQRALAQEGFDPGPVDGNYSEQTQQALRAYQRSKGLPEGGGMTIETLESMGIYE
jgi:hypothetical protein